MSSAFLFADRKDWENALIHARRSGSKPLAKLITWQYLLDGDSGANFSDYADFLEKNPDWPEQKKLHLRAELSLRTSTVSDRELIDWFADNMPVSGVGKVALAEALTHTKASTREKIEYLLRDAWRGGDFDEAQEKNLLENYRQLFTHEDTETRIDRLLWEEKTGPAKRILNMVSDAQRKLYKARIAFIDDKKLASISLAMVPSSLKNDPGLIYERMRYRARRGDDKGVREMLLLAPPHIPYPTKWWRYREMQAREAIDEHNFTLAKKLLANHGQVEGPELADAIWLQGWLKCEFASQPKEAYEDFRTMFDKVRYPVSKARAAYWAARAAEKAGDSEAANSWYDIASAYPTTFYGQLASVKRNSTAPLRIPASPKISSEARRNFETSDLTQAIKICLQQDEKDLATRLIGWLVENSDDEARIALLAELGEKNGYWHLSVRAAKKALQQNVVLTAAGYPLPKTPVDAPIERALTLAITRQESEFDPRAKSPSNAMGMMQLLKSTAKEVARKNDIGFSRDRLWEPDYNMMLGSLYLARLIGSYDGSYVMGIASYNAGPGNVRNWVDEFGTPGNQVDSAVNWIEKIPFTETRNYVQRVLENLQIYRHLDADGGSVKLKLGEDLAR